MEIKPKRCPTCVGTVIFLSKTVCDICGSELVEVEEKKNHFEDMSPQEINFITHPMWRLIEERFEEDPRNGLVIEQHGKPIAVIIDYGVMEELKRDIERLSRRGRRHGR